MELFRLANVGKAFKSGHSSFWALRHIDLLLPNVGLVAIKGRSGSGKSTLLNLLAKFLSPDEGRIFYEGKDLASFKKTELSDLRLRGVSMVFQHYNLIDNALSVDNVELPLLMAGVSKRKARDISKALFRDFGFENLMFRNIKTLSGGEKQRVAIIRSLVNGPKVVFADEPTGALDEKNSQLIMEMLRIVSKERLVVFVSHNENLISQYADRTIEIVGGEVVSDHSKQDDENSINEIKRLRGRTGKRWTWFFFQRNLKSNFLKNLVCFSSGVIGFSALLVSLGFYQGSASSLEREKNRSLESQVARIAEKSYSEIPNSPLKLVKQIRPTPSSVVDACGEIESLSFENDYSFFIPPFCSFSFEGVNQDPCSFLPVYDLSLREGDPTMLISGRLPPQNDFSSVLVNEEFATLHPDGVVGKTISFASEYEVSLLGAKEKGRLDFSFSIVGVVEEFAFLNSPKIYYSYCGLKEKMRTVVLKDISAVVGKETSIESAVTEADPNHPIANYRYLLFVHHLADLPKFKCLIESLMKKGSFLSIDASAYQIEKAFKSIGDAFSLSLLVFVGISLIGVGLILAMTSYSNFVSRKKETAILFALGGRASSISDIYVNESIFVSLLAAFASILFSPLIEMGLNRLIASKFDLQNLIAIPFRSFMGYSFALEVGLLLFAMLIAIFSSSIPLSSLKRMPLSEELRDE